MAMFPGMEFPLSPVSNRERKSFHEKDRMLYYVLAIYFWRDPSDSMRIMALWLWLERSMFISVIKKVLSLPKCLIKEIADEASMCLAYLTNPNPFKPSPEQIDLPLTQNLLSTNLTLNFFIENKEKAVLGIGKALADVCTKALSDLMKQAVERNTRALAERQLAMSSFIEQGFSRLNISNCDRINPGFRKVHSDDRTMFATFSKGYPVSEDDILEFFYSNYGNCIESVTMESVPPGEQSLYARIVFFKPHVIEAVLDGVEKAKFTVNSRHMWLRKYVPKKRKSVSPPRALLLKGSTSGLK